MSGMIYVIVPILCNEVWCMSWVIYVIVPCLCNEIWGMSGVFPEIPQASLYKHGTAQITSDIP
jgi:hypothetical protein